MEICLLNPSWPLRATHTEEDQAFAGIPASGLKVEGKPVENDAECVKGEGLHV